MSPKPGEFQHVSEISFVLDKWVRACLMKGQYMTIHWMWGGGGLAWGGLCIDESILTRQPSGIFQQDESSPH